MCSLMCSHLGCQVTSVVMFLYAYGPLLEFENVLLGRGLANAEFVRFPSLHTHNYHAAFDQDERDVLHFWHWKRSPLREMDG
jgi:hypothetical protein